MSAADDNESAGRRLSGWLGWRPRLPNEPQAAPAAPATAEDTALDANAIVEALIAGLPDPVMVLSREGRVMAFNAGIATLAPALRRGEPVSIALRVPDLVEAVRQTIADSRPRRIEYEERVPTERHFEAFISPIGHIGQQAILVTLH